MSKNSYTRREFLEAMGGAALGCGAIGATSLIMAPYCSRKTDYKAGREIVDGVEIISNPREPLYGESGSLEFARTTNLAEFFGPFREYRGLRKSLDKLARDGRPDSDYGFFFTRGSLFLDESESGQALYSLRRAFPSEIIIQSLDANPFRIIKREPPEGDLIKYLDVSSENWRDIRDLTDAIVVEAKVPEGIRRTFYFSERGLGIHTNEKNIFAVWRKLVDGEKLQHYVDIYDKREGEYLYRVPFDIDLGNFLGMDRDNNLYFGFDNPYPHIAGYSINLKK